MLQVIEKAPMGRKGWTILIATVAGAIIGAVIGYLVGQSALGSMLGAEVAAGLMAIGFALNALLPAEAWVTLAEFGWITECCLSFVVVLLASVVTLSGLLLWHSLALAALVGVGVMAVLLVVLSVLARLWWIIRSATMNAFRVGFFIIGQSRQAFFSRSEAPSECFCWHMYQSTRDMTLHPPLALVALNRKPAARGKRAPRAPSIVDVFCRLPSPEFAGGSVAQSVCHLALVAA
jgi:hypothetical protein